MTTVWVLPAIALLFAVLLLAIELGRRTGVRRLSRASEADAAAALGGFSVMEGAVFALLGLLLAFTFSAAAARFDARRQMIIDETNAIGTAYLRLDLLPPGPRTTLRELFGKYVDTRVAAYRHRGSPEERLRAYNQDLARLEALQKEIWERAVEACHLADLSTASMLVLPALNAMFDITTSRTVALRMHTPALILALLVVLAIACALLAGHGMASHHGRSWLHLFSFAGILGLTIYVILDYEFPRMGLIRIDGWDHLLVDLRSTMP